MRVKMFVFLFMSVFSVNAQGPNSMLIDIAKHDATMLGYELSLEPEQTKQLSNIYVKYALATEDVIVSPDAEIDLLKEIKALDKAKEKEIKELFSEEDYKLYEYKMEQAILRSSSDFDSLQMHLDNPDFNEAVINYFDEDVSQYLVFYYQTYFKPALKQKHYFKINQERAKLAAIQLEIDSLKAISSTNFELSDSLAQALDMSFKALKDLRKRYKEQLDYISVAMSPLKREWDLAYITMVKEHYKDDVYQSIENYNKFLNAYGIDYLVGGFSLLLFDVFYPRSYVENRAILIDMIGVN
jgi:hypothetical protein